MTAILILDNKESSPNSLMEFLSGTGYKPVGIGYADEAENFDFGRFDLIILNLFPVSSKIWDFYKTLKKKHPNLPVLVYFKQDQQSFNELGQAIQLVRHHTIPPKQSSLNIKGGNYGKPQQDIALDRRIRTGA